MSNGMNEIITFIEIIYKTIKKDKKMGQLRLKSMCGLHIKILMHAHKKKTHTHTHIYLYVYVCMCLVYIYRLKKETYCIPKKQWRGN